MKKQKSVLIVISHYYPDISKELLKGAVSELKKAGVKFETIEVPGAFEIPAAIGFAAGKYGGYIALGAVIRGETTHYDYVCAESARGLNELAIGKKLCIGYGILTTENYEQALARAAVKQENKGGFAAKTALKMMEIKGKFSE